MTTQGSKPGKMELKNVRKPDETRTFENGKIDIFNIGGGTVGKFELKPGWQWSKNVKPIAKTDLCQNAHFGYQISGRMRARMADGSEIEVGPGDIVAIPAGHDAWVVGNEPVVNIDWTGASNYAKK